MLRSWGDARARTVPASGAGERVGWRVQLEEGWLTLILLVVMLMAVVLCVQAAEWVDNLSILTWITLSGALLGVCFSRIRLPSAVLHLVSALCGLGIITYAICSTLTDGTRAERLTEIGVRLATWWGIVVGGGVGTDNLLFLMFLSCLAWAIGYWSAWAVFHWHSAWLAVIAGGAALIVNLSYAYSLSGYLVLFMITAMLLMARLHLFRQRREWQVHGVNNAGDVGWDPLRQGLLIALVVVAVAWWMPLTASNEAFAALWNRARGPWSDVENELNRWFAAVRSSEGESVSGYGSALALRGAIRLGTAVVMTVNSPIPRYWTGMIYDQYNGRGWTTAPRQRTSFQGAVERVQGASAWEARAEITQTIQVNIPRGATLFGAAQTTNIGVPASIELAQREGAVWIDLRRPTPDAPLPEERLPAENKAFISEIRQAAAELGLRGAGPSITALGADAVSRLNARLSGRPEILSLYMEGDQVGAVTVRAPAFAQYADLGPLRSEVGTWRGMTYTATSWISVADATSLRRAGIEYPAWIMEQYTQLPPTVTDRTRALAQELTRGKTNNYDRAVAIQDYLRTLSYSENIQAPPLGRDVVDYFLFEAREGYCDYFASSMVVMLRSLGIPARVAAGYATGEYDPERGVWLVRESSSHSWPEVFFPRFGWIEFEPTPSQEAIVRAEGTLDEPGSADPGESNLSSSSSGDYLYDDLFFDDLFERDLGTGYVGGTSTDTTPLEVGRNVVFGLLALALACFLLRYLWRRGLDELEPVQRTWVKTWRLANWFVLPHRPDQTAHEYAAELGRLIPTYAGNLRQIADAYVRTVFGRKPLDERERVRLDASYRSLRPALVAGFATRLRRRLTRANPR